MFDNILKLVDNELGTRACRIERLQTVVEAQGDTLEKRTTELQRVKEIVRSMKNNNGDEHGRVFLLNQLCLELGL